MKKFFKNHTGELVFSIAVIICIYFFVHILSLGAEYASGVNRQAAERAEFYTKDQAFNVRSECNYLKTDVLFNASKLSDCQTQKGFNETFRRIYLDSLEDKSILDILYVKNNTAFDHEGNVVSGHGEIDALYSKKDKALSGVFQYKGRNMAIAAYAKLSGEFADGIVMVRYAYAVTFDDFAYENGKMVECIAKSEFATILKQDGNVISRINNSNVFNIGNGTVQDGLLRNLLKEGKTYKSACDAFFLNSVSSFVFRYGTEEYILTVYPLGEDNGNLSVLSVFKVSNVYGDGYAINQSIWASLLGLAVIMIIMVATIVVERAAASRKLYRLEMIDATLNCATPKKFEKTAAELLKKHSDSKFALVSLQINNFTYIAKKFGDGALNKLTLFVTEKIRNLMQLGETFAYAGEGEFLMLINYADRQSFTERLNGLYLRLSSFFDTNETDYKISVNFAVYEILSDEKSVKEMFERLKMVKEDAVMQIGSFTIAFYEDTLRENYIKRAEIEGRMENALKNNEFHLFYQPKYNLRRKTMDGSEILIRWYDPKIEKYRVPSEFLPVFEDNGFIVKIDHFVMYKACENIKKRISERKMCFPVSVNVSRVTAIQPDFVDYYIRIKNKFEIKDDFITLEFTESFAYENYAFLSDVVQKLHENGFLCSIDDFGTGYSSYNILKTISMDEIKLDRFFLSKGLSEERDQTLLKSVIDMVKKLGMKVTQEGVETDEDLYRLDELGCDVIQGYRFSKPLKYVDYCEFIEKNFK